ncbi:amino acid/polyamine transporter I [Mycena rosella]|uniref:Amino acid/polyamine transporter I n=1 Tax=Mycena rosella TaxID=1033263 RepID=A0AAD7M6M4_MYCRO|nr:amino acid/polyamine transporter I [Mycena rosella]
MSKSVNLELPAAGDTALLASLGYKQELKREFTAIELFGFGFSVAAVVPSVASVLVYSLPNGGPSAMIWGWATSTVFLMFIAMAMAELGSSAPTSGGLYYWTFKFASPRSRNFLCWMVGYTNTISYITGVAGTDWSCAVLIMAAASIGSDGAFIPTVYQTFGVYCAVIVSHALVASSATKVIARLQHVVIAINLGLVLVMLIGLPASTPVELKNSGKYAFGSFANLTSWPNGYAFILSFLSPLWSIGGFDVGVHISEEARNASVAVPWAIISVTAIGCILGFAVQISVAFCMGQDTLSILSDPVQQPMATILLNSFGKRGMLAIWSFIFIALYMAGVSLLTSSSRQTFAFSRDGALPFSRFLYKINSVTGTPVRCVWFSATCAALLGLITFAGPAAAGALFTLGVVGQYVANSIPITARVLGGQPFKKGPFHLGVFSKPVAIIAVLWMWFMTIVLMFPSAPNPSAETMNYTVVVMGGVLFLAAVYYLFPHYGGRHWFQGPVSNVQMDQDESDLTSVEKDSPI